MDPIRLEESRPFRQLSAVGKAKLRSQVSLREVRSGEYLYFDSQPAEHLWVVRSGLVRTLKISEGGRVITLERIGPGEPFGMASVAGAPMYNESSQATAAGDVWRVGRRVFGELIATEPGLAREVLDLVAKRLQGAHERLCALAHDSVPARIARALLDGGNERLEVTRRALGESVGTTVETTIRVLRSFERAGLIESGVGWVRALDPHALEDIAEGKRGAESPPPES